MDWTRIILDFVIAIIGALGGGGLLYFRQNKKLKEVEVVKNQADEWRELFQEANKERQECESELDKRTQERDEYRVQLAEKEFEIKKMAWYKCTCNGCTKRQPPRDYESDHNN